MAVKIIVDAITLHVPFDVRVYEKTDETREAHALAGIVEVKTREAETTSRALRSPLTMEGVVIAGDVTVTPVSFDHGGTTADVTSRPVSAELPRLRESIADAVVACFEELVAGDEPPYEIDSRDVDALVAEVNDALFEL